MLSHYILVNTGKQSFVKSKKKNVEKGERGWLGVSDVMHVELNFASCVTLRNTYA